jgi:murein DD-endopeptidase MepM/ murein hydrolase activator NlpD
MPVQGVSLRSVRDTFGAPRPGDRKHQGVDIFAPRGTPVISTTRGIVSRLGENRLGGIVVWVMGPGGDRHYYAHLDSVADIRAGQRIGAGDVLGTVGNSGNARGTPPHLHYGIYRRISGAINPFSLLAAAPSTPRAAAARNGPVSAGSL